MTITIPPITSIPSENRSAQRYPLETPQAKSRKSQSKEVRKQKDRIADLALKSLSLLLLLDLQQQSAVDVWEDTTKSDGGPDEGVELLVTTDGELEVTRGDALDLEVLGGVLFDMISKLGLGRSRTRARDTGGD